MLGRVPLLAARLVRYHRSRCENITAAGCITGKPRMTSRDNNRIVRPFEWGLDWTRTGPASTAFALPQDQGDHDAMVGYMSAVNDRLAAEQRRVLRLRQAQATFHIEHRKVEFFHTGSEPPKKQPKDECRQVPALHLGRAIALPGEQSGERALVPGQGTSRGGAAAAVECRRRQPERALPHLQHAGHCGAAVEHAVSRYSPAGGLYPCRLCRIRQRGAHDRRHTPGGGRHSLLHGLAGTARLFEVGDCRHQPGLMPCVSGERPRPAYQRERLQPRVNGVRRCGVDRTIDAAHPRRAWKRHHPGRVAAGLDVRSARSCTSTNSSAGRRSR